MLASVLLQLWRTALKSVTSSCSQSVLHVAMSLQMRTRRESQRMRQEEIFESLNLKIVLLKTAAHSIVLFAEDCNPTHTYSRGSELTSE